MRRGFRNGTARSRRRKQRLRAKTGRFEALWGRLTDRAHRRACVRNGRARTRRDRRSGRSRVVCGDGRGFGSCGRNVTAFSLGFNGGVVYEARIWTRGWKKKKVVEVEFSTTWNVGSDE